MKQRDLLALLRNEPSDQTVRLAIVWLKQRKPNNPRTKKVLTALIKIPEFEKHLDWFGDWIATYCWDCVIDFARHLQSLEALDWTMALVERNPDHPEAGAVWSELLQHFYHDRIVESATKWLIDHPNDNYASWVATLLVERGQTPEVAEMAKQFFIHAPKDFSLALKLAEHLTDESIARLCLRFVESGSFVEAALVGGALLKYGVEYVDAVKRLLRKNHKSRYIELVLGELIRNSPRESAPLLIEWMEQRRASPELTEFLITVLILCTEQLVIDYAWTWFDKNQDHPKSLSLLEAILAVETAVPPSASIEFAKNWVQANRSNDFNLRIFGAVLAAMQSPDRDNFAMAFLENASHEESGAVLLKMLRASCSSIEVMDRTRAWLTDFPSHKLAPSLILELLQASPDAELIAQAKLCLDWAGGSIDPTWYAALIKANDLESIERALNWLKTPRLEKRFSSVHADRGSLIEALLVARPNDNEVRDLAGEWLRRAPESYEQAHYAAVKTAYERPELSSTT